MDTFKTETKGAENMFANAMAILLCLSITKGGFVFGVESGTTKPIY